MGTSEKYRVLVVDDEPDIQDILARLLEMSGFDVAVAGNGLRALELAKSFSPHIILLDVMMPDTSGIETLQKIREFDHEAKIIMVSGMHDVTVAKEAISLGAIDYITKPFDLKELEFYIQSLFPENQG